METMDSADYSGLLLTLLSKGVITERHKRHLEVNYIIVLSSCNSHICASHEFRLLNCIKYKNVSVCNTV